MTPEPEAIPADVKKFRKKPVVIDAVQINTREQADNVPGICTGGSGCQGRGPDGAWPHVHTLEGDHSWSPGDWLITGVRGERYFCKPDIFKATYEPASRIRADRAPVDGAGWRPIETAPKDGTRFLALEGDRHFDCWWRDFGYGEQCWMDEADTEPDPTHWMPLPAAPGTHPAPASPDAEMVKRLGALLEPHVDWEGGPPSRATAAEARASELQREVERLQSVILRAADILYHNLGRQDEKVRDVEPLLRAALQQEGK